MYVIIGGDIILREEDLVILLDTLKPATPQWKTVGLVLGFLDHELTIMERTPLLIPEGLTGYFREMLSQWLRWDPSNHPQPTLEALALALQSCGHEGLAVQLRPIFLQEKVINSANSGGDACTCMSLKPLCSSIITEFRHLASLDNEGFNTSKSSKDAIFI